MDLDIETIRNIVLDIAEEIDSINDEYVIGEKLDILYDLEERIHEIIEENENNEEECQNILEEIENIKQISDEIIYSLYSDEDEDEVNY